MNTVPHFGNGIAQRMLARKATNCFICLSGYCGQCVSRKPVGINLDYFIDAWELFGKDSKGTDPVWEKKIVNDFDDLTLKGMSITVVHYQL